MFSTYQKPHNRYLYIPYQSHHRPHVFRAFIRGELIRYAVTNTKEVSFAAMCAVFHQRLVSRGYPADFLQSVFASVSHADRQQYLQQQQQQQQLHATAPRAGPVLVVVNDLQAHSRMNLSTVVNGVYQRYQHVPGMHDVFGGRVLVAYKNPPSLHKLLVKAAD